MDESAPFDPTSPPGREVIAAIRGGDAAAFERLFRAYTMPCWRFARSIVGDADVAKDIVQDVFGWVWLHRESWAPTSDLLPYLFGAIRHRALDRQRRARLEEKTVVQHLALGESPGMAGADASSEASLRDADRRRAIHALLATLSSPQRMLLFLRWQQGLAWNEIAEVMGVSVDAAMKQHSRLLQLLRTRLPDVLE